jgi:hypothetical protein
MLSHVTIAGWDGQTGSAFFRYCCPFETFLQANSNIQLVRIMRVRSWSLELRGGNWRGGARQIGIRKR